MAVTAGALAGSVTFHVGRSEACDDRPALVVALACVAWVGRAWRTPRSVRPAGRPSLVRSSILIAEGSHSGVAVMAMPTTEEWPSDVPAGERFIRRRADRDPRRPRSSSKRHRARRHAGRPAAATGAAPRPCRFDARRGPVRTRLCTASRGRPRRALGVAHRRVVGAGQPPLRGPRAGSRSSRWLSLRPFASRRPAMAPSGSWARTRSRRGPATVPAGKGQRLSQDLSRGRRRVGHLAGVGAGGESQLALRFAARGRRPARRSGRRRRRSEVQAGSWCRRSWRSRWRSRGRSRRASQRPSVRRVNAEIEVEQGLAESMVQVRRPRIAHRRVAAGRPSLQSGVVVHHGRAVAVAVTWQPSPAQRSGLDQAVVVAGVVATTAWVAAAGEGLEFRTWHRNGRCAGGLPLQLRAPGTHRRCRAVPDAGRAAVTAEVIVPLSLNPAVPRPRHWRAPGSHTPAHWAVPRQMEPQAAPLPASESAAQLGRLFRRRRGRRACSQAAARTIGGGVGCHRRIPRSGRVLRPAPLWPPSSRSGPRQRSRGVSRPPGPAPPQRSRQKWPAARGRDLIRSRWSCPD